MTRLLALLLILIGPYAFGQNQSESALLQELDGYEFGFHMGRLLPNQIDGATEIIPLWGLRGGIGWGGVTTEFGYIGGNGEGVKWNDVHISARANIPVETLVGHVYIGIDLIDYQGANGEEITRGSGHVGGGILNRIAPGVWFRGDMKFNVNPGTSMYLGFGFTIAVPSGGGGA
tara:strand:+ start:56654 stop:57175 length:522 start_codon:yes stop_codon:yes gene_type:complete